MSPIVSLLLAAMTAGASVQVETRPSAGLQTVCCDSIDSLAWHVAIVGVSCLIGWQPVFWISAGMLAFWGIVAFFVARGIRKQ